MEENVKVVERRGTVCVKLDRGSSWEPRRNRTMSAMPRTATLVAATSSIPGGELWQGVTLTVSGSGRLD